MRALITGVGGFVGGHLARYLRTAQPELELHGTIFSPREQPPPGVTPHTVDLRDAEAVKALIAAVQPDQLYHLAAWARVRGSFEVPWETIENNARAQLNVMLGCLAVPTPPRLLIVTSGEIYGGDQPLTAPTPETAPLRPANPYSVSKAAQDLLGLQYFISHNLPVIRARPFNHLGRGQGAGFVAPDFALQIARIELGLQPAVIRVGSLSAERDFTDVRDIVRAYAELMAHGEPGEAYNVASGELHSIQFVLETLLSASTQPIRVETDAVLLRHTGVARTWGDPSKLCALTGWAPTIPLTQTLVEVLEDCRGRVQAEITSQQ